MEHRLAAARDPQHVDLDRWCVPGGLDRAILCASATPRLPPVTPTHNQTLAERVAGAAWYHTMRLPGGIVTPGNFETLAELERVPFPASLTGKRCLDVGTADGFWAFEMERRGAREVIAVDLHDPAKMDWPGTPKSDAEMRAASGPELNKHRGFEIAREALGSSVVWQEMSVYELSPELVGEFEFVFIGSLLLHLRDPVAALAAIRGVVDGELLSVDAISPLLTLLHPNQPVARLEAHGWPTWWNLNLRAYRRLFDAAGLEVIEAGRPFWLRRNEGYGDAPRGPQALHRRAQAAVIERLGILHAWVRARPRSA
jgi:tRNA (mo5U34)-methyltransferase